MSSRLSAWLGLPGSQAVIVPTALFTLALAVRLTAIDWGLPGQAFKHGMYVPDEVVELIASLLLGQRKLQIGIIRNQPFFYFLSLAFFGLYFLVTLLTGRVDSWSSFMDWFNLDLAHFILVGRVMVVILGAATAVLVYYIGRRLFNQRTGVLAALFLALSLGHTAYSRVLRLDSVMPFLVALGYWLMLSVVFGRTDRLRTYVLTGLALSAAAMTKTTGFAMLLPFVAIPVLDPKRTNLLPLRRPLLSRQYVFALVVFLAAYLALAGPTYVFEAGLGETGALNIESAVLGGVTSRLSTAETYRNLGGLSTYDRSFLWHLTSSLPALLGWPVYGLSLVGLIGLMPLRRNRAAILILVLGILAFLLPIGYLQRAAERDMLPILPLLAITAAYGLVRIVEWVEGIIRPGGNGRRHIALVLAAAPVLASASFDAVRHTSLLLKEDTRVTAARWIEANLPPGSRIALEPFGPNILDADPVGGTIELGRQYAQEGRPTYELYELQEWLTVRTDVFEPQRLDPFLREQQIDYVVLSSGYYYRFYNPSMDHHFPLHARQGRRFHDLLVSRLDALHKVLPDWKDAPGPTILIYEVRNRPAPDSVAVGLFEPYPDPEYAISAAGYEEALRP